MLINSLLSHANDARWEEFIAELERLNVRRAVIVSLRPLVEQNIHNSLAINVFAHHRRPDILHLGFPGKYGSCDIQEEDNVGGPRERAHTCRSSAIHLGQ